MIILHKDDNAWSYDLLTKITAAYRSRMSRVSRIKFQWNT